MNVFKYLWPLVAISGALAMVSSAVAQDAKAEPVYLEEPSEEPPPSVVRHRKAQGKFENGQLRMEREEALLSDDTVVSDGVYIEYYPDGQKFCEGKYENGVIAGDWKYWHPNGQLCKSIIFKNGKPDGKIEVFREDGTLQDIQSYLNGVRNGEWVSYYEDGKSPKVKATIKDGKINGERTTYYPDGTLKQQTNFVEGVLDGVVTEYDATGKKIGEATFEKGQRKSIERFE